MKTITHTDDRGKHTKFFVANDVKDLGFKSVKEIFMTTNNKGTLRGLHRQFGKDVTQQKIIKAISGSFNVRVVFPTNEVDFSQFQESLEEKATEIYLYDNCVVAYYDNMNFESDPILVPAGAYLGYLSLEENSQMLYIGDNDFNGEADDGRYPLSETLDIDWGEVPIKYLSLRDKEAQKF